MTSGQQFHFISGLPRAGSTLLSAILRQNPRFRAGMTSPVGALFNGLLEQVSAGSEFGTVISRDKRRRLLRGLFDSYYADQPDDSVVFDTNRLWSARLPALRDLFPQSKVIACVRNVAWVMDSLERLYRANPFENTRLFNDAVERNTVYSRVDTLGQRNRLVGFSWTAIKEAFYGEQAGSLLLVDYDLLAQAPEKVLPLVYQFIGEPWFDGHDFGQLEFDAPEFDSALGLSGLHKVRPRVALEPRRTILPPDLFAQYQDMSFWHDVANSTASVITAKKTISPSQEAP
ncbi:sulfotransferase [Actimicrobium sp. CCI2.3]|uniref:sulfotransferase family protein n=1 Tax=Actimicrobium sp. CCI2.3 TaxID=3048616 RepID=UPI002AB579F2|nr:sulfotransferase [Actimicrobium sp. CCI2.3]MDY7575082.1 sulfotransferase [Actimicrobium sp. CCI2.3]MEB0022577.1 sulfotransferase [Actimicrobium sp. CCI2.3]